MAYTDTEEAKSFLGAKAKNYDDETIEQMTEASAEIIDNYCIYHGLEVNGSYGIVSIVSKELIKVMASDTSIKSERVGELSYTYKDKAYDGILSKLNYLPKVKADSSQSNSVRVRVI